MQKAESTWYGCQARTGTHLGGNWVEVDDEGNEHSDSNIRTYSVRR